MIDIKLIRENKDLVKENIKKKFQDHKLPLVDEVYDLDIQFRETKQEGDNLRSLKNNKSSEIGLLMRNGKKEEAENLKQAFSLVKGLLGLNEKIFFNSFILYYLKGYIFVLILGIIFATPILQKIWIKLQNSKLNKILNFIQPFCMIILLLLVTTFLVDNSYNPFLYFRF